MFAVEGHGDNASGGGFPDAAWSCEQDGVWDSSGLDGVLEGSGDVSLPCELFEALGAPLSGEHNVGHDVVSSIGGRNVSKLGAKTRVLGLAHAVPLPLLPSGPDGFTIVRRKTQHNWQGARVVLPKEWYPDDYRTVSGPSKVERVGFEPTKGFHLYTRSRRAPSTTRPPLQKEL